MSDPSPPPDATEAGRLLDEARRVAAGAYAPYSGYRVGAVAVTVDGDHHHGVNVENAAYPATSCAEANAVAAAVAAGNRRVVTVAVGCLDGDECLPCGNCRQVMSELGVTHVVAQTGGRVVVHELDELLPRSFGPRSLPDGPPGPDR